MNLKFEIHSAKELSSERSLELVMWFDKEFGKIPFQWAEPEWFVLALSDSKLIGRLGIVERKVSVNKRFLSVAGISGVVTDKDSQGTGVASLMLRSAEEFIREQLNLGYRLLLCRVEVAPVYEKLGWRTIDGPTTFDQPSGKTVFPRLTMILGIGKEPMAEGTCRFKRASLVELLNNGENQAIEDSLERDSLTEVDERNKMYIVLIDFPSRYANRVKGVQNGNL